MILTKTQVEAIYSAMCALNNVGGMLTSFIRTDSGGYIKVSENYDGILIESCEVHLPPSEAYRNQSAFADAYGLQ